MSILINLYNQIGAGPKNISLNLIQGLERISLTQGIFVIIPDVEEYADLVPKNPQLRLLKYPRKQRLLDKVWFRLYLELWLIPSLMRRYSANRLLAFGNFLFTPGSFSKLVLCHHPYLYDNQLFQTLGLRFRIIEQIKRVAFWLTLLNVRHLVVQSQYVAQQVRKNWRLSPDMNVHVIPNPISNTFEQLSREQITTAIIARQVELKNKLKLVYVSRFYPHKNHDFLLKLSTELNKRGIKHEIQVTIDSEIASAQNFLQKIKHTENTSIVNLGEQHQRAMTKIYQQGHIFIFPSHAETFGNPMIEAMCYGLPLVLPDLGYAKAVASSAGNYYPADDEEACAKLVTELAQNETYYTQRSLNSHDTFKNFPNVDQWITIYLNTLKKASYES